MKKYILLILIVMFFINTQLVFANIMCNDGTESPTCTSCHQGCCSWHGGCASNNSNNSINNSDNSSIKSDNSSIINSIILISIFVIYLICYFMYDKIKNKKSKQIIYEYLCPDCGKSIKYDVKKCENCGCNLDWSHVKETKK